MSNYDTTNSGALFPVENPKKATSPKFTGKLNVEGSDYVVAAWVNSELADDFVTKENFLSFKLSYKDRNGEWQNPNARGKLKKNPDKVQSQPDFKGFVSIDDESYDLVAWNRESKAGNSFLSLAIDTSKTKTSDIDKEAPDFDDDMPF